MNEELERINFENLPSTNTPINADNLNKLQDNTNDLANKIQTKIDEINKAIENGVGSSVTIKRWEEAEE